MNTEKQLQQAADRLAIRNLVDQYAYCADTRFIVFMDAKSAEPTQMINKRADLFPVFDNLNTYSATMRLNAKAQCYNLRMTALLESHIA